MLLLCSISDQIAAKRRTIGLSQIALAKKAKISRATLNALENGRLGEIGYAKITNILTALGLELRLQETTARRPTLEDLMNEGSKDQTDERNR